MGHCRACCRRPKSYLLVLLTLKAYQQHIASPAAAAGSCRNMPAMPAMPAIFATQLVKIAVALLAKRLSQQ
jgi:hypothetical protein